MAAPSTPARDPNAVAPDSPALYYVYSTPVTGNAGRTALQNPCATYSHKQSANAIIPAYMSSYFDGKPQKYGITDELRDALNDDRGSDFRDALWTVRKDANANRVEPSRYRATTSMLNCLSLLYATVHKLKYAVIFGGKGARELEGSYLGLQFKPDYFSYVGKIEELRAAIDRGSTPDVPWSLIIGVGEHKTKSHEQSQIMSYTSLLKRYRPDLPTVHGFHVSGTDVYMTSLNACGMVVSKPYVVYNRMPWMAHVASLYHAYHTSNDKLRYCFEQPDFHRWDVYYGPSPFAAVPFHVGTAPGRVTFAAFELAPIATSRTEMTRRFFDEEAKGFFKVSWQDTSAGSKEAELLKDLHSEGWLPGLVRPRYVQRLEAPISREGDDVIPQQRVLEVIHLGSIGEPLSQATSIRHLLYIYYDVLETHLRMCKKDVLHRDLSWYNILILPRHTVSKGKTELEGRCISQIMAAAGVQLSGGAAKLGRREPPCDDGSPFEPCALITDLDHSVKISTHTGARLDRTGTPMFIACELAERKRGFTDDAYSLELLFRSLKEIEDSPAGQRVFAAAFPNGDDDFLEKFRIVVVKETERRAMAEQEEEDDPQLHNPALTHEWRHDVQSAYWSLLWAFSRARPLDEPDLEDPESVPATGFDAFCRAMLFHEIDGKRQEGDRATFLESHTLRKPFFHPKFLAFQRLFVSMAVYLTIPWHLYIPARRVSKPGQPLEQPDPRDPDALDEDHAHIAFRRLILAYLVRDKLSHLLDVALDTEQPRVTTIVDDVTVTRGRSEDLLAATGHSESLSKVMPGPAGLQRQTEPVGGFHAQAAKNVAPPRAVSDSVPILPHSLASQDRPIAGSAQPSVGVAGSLAEVAGAKGPGRGKGKNSQPTAPTRIQPLRGPRNNTGSATQPTLKSSASQKRTRDDIAASDGAGPSKKLKSSQRLTPEASMPPPATKGKGKGKADKQDAYKVQIYCAELHAFGSKSHTVNALRLKTWKDKLLWFGSGRRSAIQGA